MRKLLGIVLLLAFSASVFAVHVSLSSGSDEEMLMTLDVCNQGGSYAVDTAPAIAVPAYSLLVPAGAVLHVERSSPAVEALFISEIDRPPIV